MTKQEKNLWGVMLVLIGIAALQNPNCKNGCKTWAAHLLNHGLQVIL